MSSLFDTSHELMVCRFRDGIKLLRHQQVKKGLPFVRSTGHTVKEILRQHFCTYFTDLNTRNFHINEATVAACGFDSPEEAHNKTLYTVMHKSSVDKIVQENEIIIKSTKQKIHEHVSIRKDGALVPTISVTSPWYNDDNKIIGVFGCTIVLGMQPLAESLAKIVNLGILSTDNSFANVCGRELEDVYLSKRELECAQLTLIGKSAKNIAHVLGLSQRTVEEYLTNIKVKLGVSSKSEMIEKLYFS